MFRDALDALERSKATLLQDFAGAASLIVLFLLALQLPGAL